MENKDGDQVVSGLYRLPFELRIGDQLFQMGGIGDVMTYPEYGMGTQLPY